MESAQSTTNPAKITRNHHIAELSLQGLTSEQIAERPEINIRGSLVRKVLRDDQCQEILDHVMRVNIAHAKGINKKFLRHCYSDDAKISLDAIKQYQKNIGITPSHTQSIHIQNIFNQVNIGPLTPAALDYMEYLKDRDNDDVVDVMPE